MFISMMITAISAAPIQADMSNFANLILAVQAYYNSGCVNILHDYDKCKYK